MASQSTAQQSIFGRVRMGYTLAESRRADQWYRFTKEALGMHVQRDAGALVCRLDEHARRIIVVDGPAEDFLAAQGSAPGPATRIASVRGTDAQLRDGQHRAALPHEAVLQPRGYFPSHGYVHLSPA